MVDSNYYSHGYRFSSQSEQILNGVRAELRTLAHRVLEISPIDFAIVEGYRDKKRQLQLYREGRSRTLNSKHCMGMAIDVVPYMGGKADYAAVEDCCFIAGMFLAVANQCDLKIRLGAIWDRDSIKNNAFVDVWHVELVL